MSGYHTLVVDPPWPYKNPGEFTSGATAEARGGGSHARYGALSIDDIIDLDPPIENDSHLYLWTTNAFVCEAHEIARAWGFRPITMCTWVKTTTQAMKCPQCKEADQEFDLAPEYDDVTPIAGGWVRTSARTGYYFKGATEHCLFAVKGRGGAKWRQQIPTAWHWPREPHSVKPDAFYDMVERMSPEKYLEMFARRNRLNWETWGDQALEHVVLGEGQVVDL